METVKQSQEVSSFDEGQLLTVGEVVVQWPSEPFLRSSIFERGENRFQLFWRVKSRNLPLNATYKQTCLHTSLKKKKKDSRGT